MAALRAERKKEILKLKQNEMKENEMKENDNLLENDDDNNYNNIEIYDIISELDTNVSLPLRIIGYNVSKFLCKENGNINFNKSKDIIGLLLAHGLGPKNPKEKNHLNDKYVDLALKAINDINKTIKSSIISISYTARGHGNSIGWENTAETNPEQFTWQNKLSDDMISLANKFQLSKFIACGSSMGSATSLYAAIKYPELVHSIILMRPPTAWNDRLLRRKTLLSSANKCQEANKDELYHLVIRGTAYSDLPSLEDKESYEKIKCPILILTIEGDDSHPISTAQAIKTMIPHAELYISDNEKNAKKKWPNIIKTFIEQHIN